MRHTVLAEDEKSENQHADGSYDLKPLGEASSTTRTAYGFQLLIASRIC